MCDYCADELKEINKTLKVIQQELHSSNENKAIIVASLTEILNHLKIQELMDNFADMTIIINQLNKQLINLKNNQVNNQENKDTETESKTQEQSPK